MHLFSFLTHFSDLQGHIKDIFETMCPTMLFHITAMCDLPHVGHKAWSN